MSDLKDLTLNPFKVTWVNSVGISLWVENECPYQSDLMWVKMSVPIKMNGIDEIWTRISEMKWIEWNEWFDGFDLEQPYGNGPMVSRRCPYQNDLICLLWPNPFKMIRIDEKWVNRVKWSEMMDLMDLTWMNPMARSLWSEESVHMRVTWDEWFDQTLSKWSESMRFDWIEVNRGE